MVDEHLVEDIIEGLQQETARLEGERRAAQQAAREILGERNTWARQLADMRDERDAAWEEMEKARTLWAGRENDALAREVALEGVLRDFLAEYDNFRLPWDWKPNGIDKMRRVLNDD